MKRKSLLSIIFNAVITITCIISISLLFNQEYVSRFATKGETGIACFRYYTVLSNLLLAISSIIMIINKLVNKNKQYKWVYYLKFIATVSTSVTFITVVIFLSPVVALGSHNILGYFTLFKNHNFILHFLNPILGILTFVLFENDIKFNKYDFLLGESTVFIYSIIYFINVVITKVWDDFYFFTFNGTMWMIPISILFMYGLGFGISLVLSKLYKSANKLNNY